MEIRLRLPDIKTKRLKALLVKKLKRSRFYVPEYRIKEHVGPRRYRYGCLRIYEIRLKKRKPYHGNTPDGRTTMVRGGSRRCRMSFLEGADWIEFNDLLNDFCDELGLCADINSKTVVIRKGYWRRIRYRALTQNSWGRSGSRDDFVRVGSCNGPFPMSDLSSANSIGRLAGIYRNIYAGWSDDNGPVFCDERLLVNGYSRSTRLKV